MDIIFDIIDNSPDIILVTVVCVGYAVIIGKSESIVVNIRNDDINIHRSYKNIHSKKYEKFKDFIIYTISNAPILLIKGISSIQNKEYLEQWFETDSNFLSDEIINIYKKFT